METLQSIQFYRLALAIFVPLAVLCSLFFLISRRRRQARERKENSIIE
ncbi:MAG TPA: hypothetical protein PKK12_15440 [Candidatus Aminicenantes bacterium]|nr:hypothetical protein [Candidatus Aminicenantes bacterium]